MGFRVFYRQGSFALVEVCSTWDEAVALVRRVRLRRGVWHVRIEDAGGRPVRDDFDLCPPWEGSQAIGSGIPDAEARPGAARISSVNALAKHRTDTDADDDELSLPLSHLGRRRALPAR